MHACKLMLWLSLCLAIARQAIVSCEALDLMLEWSEFEAEYRKEKSSVPELEAARNCFPRLESVVSPKKYAECLGKAFNHLEELMVGHHSEKEIKKLKKEIVEDIAEFVKLRKNKGKFTLRDFYRDMFMGELNSWLKSYQFGLESLQAPPAGDFGGNSAETAVDL